MYRRTLPLVALSLLAFRLLADSVPIPAGFTWQAVPEIKARFLVPPGWQFHVLGHDPLSLIIVADDYATLHRYDTGFHAVVTKGKPGSDTSARAQKVRDQWASIGAVKTPAFEEPNGKLSSYGVVVEFTPKGEAARMVVAVIAVANPVTGTVFAFTFQAPANTWDKAWESGQYIIGRFDLDDEV